MRLKHKVLGALVGAMALLGVVVAPASPALASTYVSGSVTCVDGQLVTGVFVHANSGGGGWGQGFTSNTSSTASWHYTLPNNGSYYLAVGCGGSPASWATTNYSNNYSGNSNGLLCYDFTYEVPANKQFRCV